MVKELEGIPALLVRAGVWGLLFGILFLLRSFSLLIFLTFVFAYIQANGVRRLTVVIANRSLRVVLVAVAFLGLLSAIGFFIVPKVSEQAELFADRYPVYLRTLDERVQHTLEEYIFLQQFVSTSPGTRTDGAWDIKKSPSAAILQQVFAVNAAEDGKPDAKATIQTIRNVSTYLFGISSAFLLSLLFSFLIVLDLPRLTQSVTGLKDSKLAFIYYEVAENIYNFGAILGRALEAQLFIALLNTAMTAVGITVLGLSNHTAFLSVIVFLCSFIPVAGVFISSVPICLVALQESGVTAMFLAILMITLIHLIEAYILNPKIYGHHLRMNPVIVLIILTIGGKLFHVWGLVLGVPVCTYIFSHAIRYEKSEPLELKAQE